MNNSPQIHDPDIEREKLAIEREKIDLERRKNRLDYKKFVLGSVFVALAIVAILPLFQLASVGLEYVKSNADRQAQQQAFRDEYIKEFINNALNQDIELRIRFAQYFARVSTEPTRGDWDKYLEDLKQTRGEIRGQINEMEEKWSTLASDREHNAVEIARIERNLAWAYNEVGYVERNRSVAANPRDLENKTQDDIFLSSSFGRFKDNHHYTKSTIHWTPNPDQPQHEDVYVPSGFVFNFEGMPLAFGHLLESDVNYLYPAAVREYLYWEQSRSRHEADEIFTLGMKDFGVDEVFIETITAATRAFGAAAWNENQRLKSSGEKRILKELPDDPNVLWSIWKIRPSVFQETAP